MTINTSVYTLPKLETFKLDSFDQAPDFKPQLTLLDIGGGKATRFWRPYRVCYLDRCSLDQSIKSTKELAKVNLSSLCPDRISLVTPIVKGLLEGHSGIPRFNIIETVFNWIDQNHRSRELKSIEASMKLYRDYTDHLRHLLRLSNVGQSSKSIGHSLASTRQLAMAYLCAQTCSRDIRIVQSWAIRIPQQKPGDNELPTPATTAEEHAIAYALHDRFFYAFSNAVLNETTPPVVVELEDLGYEDLIYYNMHANNARGWSTSKRGERTDWQPHFYQRTGIFKGKPKAFNTLLAELGIEPIRTDNYKSKQDSNRIFSASQIRELANHATRHFSYLLLAEAGNNAGHLSTIDCNHSRLDKALGLGATRAIKGRAGFEEQDQNVDIRFAKTTWKQYFKLRSWMGERLENPPEAGIFLLPSKRNAEPYSFVTAISMRQLPHWPANAPSLETRPARKHKTVNLVEATGGNVPLVATMQSATVPTIQRHYNFKNQLEAAEAMSEYFSAQAESAELRYRGIQPVRIIEGGESIHTGHCDDGTDEPRLLEGFEDLGIEPRCSAPITCIFCAHFGLHADVEDLLRLLSINSWIEIQSRLTSINIDEHYQKFVPYLNRIQQMLEALPTINSEILNRMKEAQLKFDSGERDPYWNAKINALLEIEDT